MRTVKLRRLALCLLLVPAAGCGSGSGQFAGLTEYDAASEAQNVVAEELKSPNSLFHGEHVDLGAVGQGRNSAGHEAWIVEYTTEAGNKRICVILWAESSPFRTTITYEVDTCRPNEPLPLDNEA
jgi:hypothetical protein